MDAVKAAKTKVNFDGIETAYKNVLDDFTIKTKQGPVLKGGADLQKKFDESTLDFNVEVINAGIGRGDSATESYYIKTKLVNFDPDMFIIYDGWNDAINSVQYVEYEDIRRHP